MANRGLTAPTSQVVENAIGASSGPRHCGSSITMLSNSVSIVRSGGGGPDGGGLHVL